MKSAIFILSDFSIEKENTKEKLLAASADFQRDFYDAVIFLPPGSEMTPIHCTQRRHERSL